MKNMSNNEKIYPMHLKQITVKERDIAGQGKIFFLVFAFDSGYGKSERMDVDIPCGASLRIVRTKLLELRSQLNHEA